MVHFVWSRECKTFMERDEEMGDEVCSCSFSAYHRKKPKKIEEGPPAPTSFGPGLVHAELEIQEGAFCDRKEEMDAEKQDHGDC